ncbi:MAG TPA: glycosyltransferase family 2 protein, partial [Acidobacteriota bacterium]|nr:glycosyltransferase family 2 protein [Acidobacteriota bacterium]
TMFHPDAIGKLARHFADPKIGAVAGNAKVGNRINLLTRWQALEYITSQNLDRKAYDTLNCISVVPGAIGAWRRELIIKAGGFTHQTLAEDADLTMAILRLGYRIVYEDQAIAYTEAPDSISAFLKQRFRWMFGTLQAVWKNRDAVFQPRYRALGMFVLPNVLIFQIFFPLISPLMDLMMVFAVVSTFWQRSQHPTDYSSDGLVRALAFYALFVAIDLMAAVTAFLLESREDFTLIRWLFLQRFFYRQLMYFVAIKSTLTAIRGSLVGWGKLERKATVNLAQ